MKKPEKLFISEWVENLEISSIAKYVLDRQCFPHNILKYEDTIKADILQNGIIYSDNMYAGVKYCESEEHYNLRCQEYNEWKSKFDSENKETMERIAKLEQEASELRKTLVEPNED